MVSADEARRALAGHEDGTFFNLGGLGVDLAHTVVVQAEQIAALRSALERTEANFRTSVSGKPVRDMTENLAENASALGLTS